MSMAPGRFTVSLSTLTSPLHNRFTLAHEPSHYFLHSEFGAQKIRADRGIVNEKPAPQQVADIEADWFAAELLMPRGDFEPMANDGTMVGNLAEHFLVSQDAVRSRLKSLGFAS